MRPREDFARLCCDSSKAMDAAEPLQNLLLTDVCATAKLPSQRSQLMHVMPRCELHSRCAGSHEDSRRNALLHALGTRPA